MPCCDALLQSATLTCGSCCLPLRRSRRMSCWPWSFQATRCRWGPKGTDGWGDGLVVVRGRARAAVSSPVARLARASPAASLRVQCIDPSVPAVVHSGVRNRWAALTDADIAADQRVCICLNSGAPQGSALAAAKACFPATQGVRCCRLPPQYRTCRKRVAGQRWCCSGACTRTTASERLQLVN